MVRARRLEGKGCLIIGGSGGIGLATARRFLEEGARVVVGGRTSGEAEAAHQQLADLGEVWPAAADVNTVEEVEELFVQALERLGGRLDVLFHVAGISGRPWGDGPLHECSDEAWDWMMRTNARGVFLTNRVAVRLMLKQPLDEAGLRGTVLNVGSVLTRSPSPVYFGTVAYAASKGAVEALTLSAAARYAPERIRFNVLAPALIDTPMAARAVGDPAIRAYLATKQPIAGGPGTAEDCAEAALCLCEPASRFVTGTVLTVDGGWSIAEGQCTASTPAAPPPPAPDQESA